MRKLRLTRHSLLEILFWCSFFSAYCSPSPDTSFALSFIRRRTASCNWDSGYGSLPEGDEPLPVHAADHGASALIASWPDQGQDDPVHHEIFVFQGLRRYRMPVLSALARPWFLICVVGGGVLEGALLRHQRFSAHQSSGPSISLDKRPARENL